MTQCTITEIMTEPDALGRQRFMAEWPADNIGPRLNESGIRGQCFFTRIQDWIKQRNTEGAAVTIATNVSNFVL